MRRIMMSILLLASCSGDAGAGSNQAQAPAAAPAEVHTSAPEAAPASLVGLYEGGVAGRQDQLCVLRKGGETQFGIVVWGSNDHSCSGSGTLSREGSAVKLKMSGDSPCTVKAVAEGETIRLAAEQAQGCSYYCGARARFDGASLTRRGATEQDAMKATDLVGEPLCDFN